MQICGVTFSAIDRELLFARLRGLLGADNGSFEHYMTVNPEYLVAAAKNPRFLNLLNRVSCRVVDGVGVLAAIQYKNHLPYLRNKVAIFRYLQFLVSVVDVGVLRHPVLIDGKFVERIAGVDLITGLVGQKWMSGKRVFLLGGRAGVAQKAAAELRRLNSRVEFGWSQGHQDVRSKLQALQDQNELHSESYPFGGTSEESREEQDARTENQQILDEINSFMPEVLLVAYGHPWQDLWIDQVKEQLVSVRLAMGVGGSFDYIADEVPRAPVWMRELGLEWLYRVVRQPERIGRIVDATWGFARLVVKEVV